MDKNLLAKIGSIPIAIMTIEAFFEILERFGIDIPSSKQFDPMVFRENRTVIFIILGALAAGAFIGYFILWMKEKGEKKKGKRKR